MTRAKRAFAVCAAAILTPATGVAQASLECSFVEDSQVEIADCLSEAEERADLALETVLVYARDAAFDVDEVTGRGTAMPALDAAQKAWLEFRDKACAHRATLAGTGAATALTSCKIEMTRARTRDLYAFFK